MENTKNIFLSLKKYVIYSDFITLTLCLFGSLLAFNLLPNKHEFLHSATFLFTPMFFYSLYVLYNNLNEIKILNGSTLDSIFNESNNYYFALLRLFLTFGFFIYYFNDFGTLFTFLIFIIPFFLFLGFVNENLFEDKDIKNIFFLVELTFLVTFVFLFLILINYSNEDVIKILLILFICSFLIEYMAEFLDSRNLFRINNGTNIVISSIFLFVYYIYHTFNLNIFSIVFIIAYFVIAITLYRTKLVKLKNNLVNIKFKTIEEIELNNETKDSFEETLQKFKDNKFNKLFLLIKNKNKVQKTKFTKLIYKLIKKHEESLNLINNIVNKELLKVELNKKIESFYNLKLKDLENLYNLNIILESYKNKKISKENKHLYEQNIKEYKTFLKKFKNELNTYDYIILNINNINNHQFSNNEEVINYVNNMITLNQDNYSRLKMKYNIPETKKENSNDR